MGLQENCRKALCKEMDALATYITERVHADVKEIYSDCLTKYRKDIEDNFTCLTDVAYGSILDVLALLNDMSDQDLDRKMGSLFIFLENLSVDVTKEVLRTK